MTETVRVHIRRVTFEGLPARQHAEALAAFERELRRLLADQPLTPSGTGRRRPSGAGSPGAVGARMARSVHERLRAEGATP